MTSSRESWRSGMGFLFAAIGSAIGLGVLWKFPYTIGNNGGGLFLLTYFVCILIIGIPVLIAELLLGRESRRASIGAFTVPTPQRTFWKIGGVLGFLSSFLIMSFYSVVAGWGMSYILMSLTGLYRNPETTNMVTVFQTLSRSGGITLFWQFLFVACTTAIVVSGVRKGIEFWGRIMTRALFVMLVGLFVYALSLDGFLRAFRFVFYPDITTLKPSGILEALGLAFFTLSLGQGVMISYGSYTGRTTDIPLMSLIIGCAVTIIAILTALTIFPIVFTFGLKPEQGTGLVFQTLPYLFAALPGSQVLSTLFFTLFVFTAFTSAVPFIEVVSTNLTELFGWSRKQATLVAATAMFLFGIPGALSGSDSLFREWTEIYGQNFFDTIDSLCSVWIIPFAGLFASLYTGWVLKKEEIRSGFSPGTDRNRLFACWYFSVRWMVPLFIVLIIAQKSGLINVDMLTGG
ncbi:MAG: sodium-dependent transporter [Simkaniaceae bacterium]|nr:sodium-dependent transporter [Simkaniaceae bacterium]